MKMLKVNTDGKRYKELREYWIFRILPEPKISKKGQLTHTLTNLALHYSILPLYNHNVVLIFDVVFILSTWDTKKGGPDTELGTYIGWDASLNLLDEKTKFVLYSFKFWLETAEIWVALKICYTHMHRQTELFPSLYRFSSVLVTQSGYLLWIPT